VAKAVEIGLRPEKRAKLSGCPTNRQFPASPGNHLVDKHAEQYYFVLGIGLTTLVRPSAWSDENGQPPNETSFLVRWR
jgi:hypothetical protein